MATTQEYIEYVCEQLHGMGEVRYRKMFGEYMVYYQDKPVMLVCDNTAFVKKLDCISEEMANAECGVPYQGAKEHYILDVDNAEFCQEIVKKNEAVTPLPKPKKKKC